MRTAHCLLAVLCLCLGSTLSAETTPYATTTTATSSSSVSNQNGLRLNNYLAKWNKQQAVNRAKWATNWAKFRVALKLGKRPQTGLTAEQQAAVQEKLNQANKSW